MGLSIFAYSNLISLGNKKLSDEEYDEMMSNHISLTKLKDFPPFFLLI